MSDSVDDIIQNYRDHVLGRHPRSIGLFPIPEYPEFDSGQGMWSEALGAILTTLQYLAPATLLTLFWGQQSFLFRILKHIDSAFRAIAYSSEEQKQDILQWIAEAGSARVEHLDTVWRHGWIVCGILDAAFPGACAGHPPTRLNLKHAQAIADHYLGVEPVFTTTEFETCETLSKHQEWRLATYLDRIRQALSKLTPPVSKPTSQRTSPDNPQTTLDYVAKGSGLTACQAKNKAYFKIYPTVQQTLEPGEVTILIRGPKDTYGMAVLPPILGKAQMIRQKVLGLQNKTTYTESALPLTQGTAYLRSYGKNHMNKTYYIPKSKYDIDIEEDAREDHVKIGYVVDREGKYEVSITSRGQNIVGSPFRVTATNNILNVLENDSHCLEDGETLDIFDAKTDRKVVLRIVDFVTEKMLLRENGSFEKISDDEAERLMSTATVKDSDSLQIDSTCTAGNKLLVVESTKFKSTAMKVVQMNRICKILNGSLKEKLKRKLKEIENGKKKDNTFSRSNQLVPDIVNSTFGDSNPFLLTDIRDKFIVPEKIAVSLMTEKTTPMNVDANHETEKSSLNTPLCIDTPDSLEYCTQETAEASRASTSSNPFLDDIYEQNYAIEKDLKSFVKTEYERNNGQNEETDAPSIKIVVEAQESKSPSPINKNPFIEPDVINLERPKTPVLKIITGDVVLTKNRNDLESIFVNPKAIILPDDKFGNEFINPFFIHQHENSPVGVALTDFIIGAPVSLPPIIRASTPEPSILITETLKGNVESQNSISKDESSSSLFATPLHTNSNKVSSCISSTFHSLDSNLSESMDLQNFSISVDNQNHYQVLQNDAIHKRDMWDSAYVSIDDTNISPDNNNNNDNITVVNETLAKQKTPLNEFNCEYINMGPAEREIWQSEMQMEAPKVYDDSKSCRWESRRNIFTPILEESDKSISMGHKDMQKNDIASKPGDTETDKVAFPKLTDISDENDQYSDSSSYATPSSMNKESEKDTQYTIESSDTNVDSASDISDVKRRAKELEGEISEVQENATESVSVSQTLPNSSIQQTDFTQSSQRKPNNETQFGDNTYNNIVLERKQYWDERIKEIEAQTETETKTQEIRRRLSSKYLRQHNDSLTKRRSKEVAKNFFNSSNKEQTTVKTSPTENNSPTHLTISEEIEPVESKLVEKWKKYWDTKLEIEKDDMEVSCFRAKSPKSNESLSPRQRKHADDKMDQLEDIQSMSSKSSSVPAKQELPEEIFKAFETSPKRFFGTSRKQILNKIDTFLGKPSTVDESSADVTGATPDAGLVSSRISLFHNISQSEDRTLVRRKCQSMQNIFQRKDSERSTTSVDEVILDTDTLQPETRINEKIEDAYEKLEVLENIEQTANNTQTDKRLKLSPRHNIIFDETVFQNPTQDGLPTVKKAINEYNKYDQKHDSLRKSTVSKSEMDIFTKIANKPQDDDLDKYKSCDELPKINVKNVISLYENVSKHDLKLDKPSITHKSILQKQRNCSSFSGATPFFTSTVEIPTSEYTTDFIKLTPLSGSDMVTQETQNNTNSQSSSTDIEVISDKGLETTYLSLSDIELEIVPLDGPNEFYDSTNEKPNISTDYRSRFKMAKQYFQSLEELPDVKKPAKLNECEMLLINKSDENTDNVPRPPKRTKKKKKSNSMPSSEIAKIWTQYNETQNDNTAKLMKISEKFNVDDLYNDVMEGKLSRQGSLRGIPHKKAVLEAFKSMENLVDSKMCPYDIATKQLTDFAQENKIINAQTYLTEYPFLPTTEPSKSQSRLDTKATGLISLKELKDQKPRRNSVPDVRMNTKFIVDL